MKRRSMGPARKDWEKRLLMVRLYSGDMPKRKAKRLLRRAELRVRAAHAARKKASSHDLGVIFAFSGYDQ